MIKAWSYIEEYKGLRKKILKTIDRTLKSGQIFFGKELQKFEKQFIKENNIQVNINYPFPIHKMKAYKNKVLNKSNYLPITEKMANGIFSLPLYPKLKKTDVFKVSRVIKKILSKI